MTTDETTEQKQQQWKASEQFMNLAHDALGREIDPGILDLCVALHAHGFYTAMSCEGHLDHGLPYPWITFSTQEAHQCHMLVGQKSRELAEARRQSEPPDPESLKRFQQEANDLRERADTLLLPEQKRMLALLSDFYSNDGSAPSHQDRIIPNHRMSGISRLEVLSGPTNVGDPEECARRLSFYQQEMKRFADFLKEQFFTE